jgi:hypothetical protein
MPKLTVSRLKTLLGYDPKRGEFRWRVQRSPQRPVGSFAGVPRPDGRVVIRIDRILYLRSRLAWLYMRGRWPCREVDHRDLDHGNDRYRNLRLATRRLNEANKKSRRGAMPKGVFFDKRRGKYRAYIAGKHLGMFTSLETAALAYGTAAHRTFGPFARPNGMVAR